MRHYIILITYKDKIEFICIDCHDSREVWLKTVVGIIWIGLICLQKMTK